MDLGARHIRTAGKGSGSIELTLPAALRDLVGLRCRVFLRDGFRPDIVLQPDLAAAQAAFETIWREMAACLPLPQARGTQYAPPMPQGAFLFGLHPRMGADAAAPFLAWRDGIKLAAGHKVDAAALSRVIASFGHAMAGGLDIGPGLAAGFGAACGYLVTGVAPAPDWQEPCDVAAACLRPLGAPGAAWLAASGREPAGAPIAALWVHAAPVLGATSELFQAWTETPATHAHQRAAWRRGRGIEMSREPLPHETPSHAKPSHEKPSHEKPGEIMGQ
jgi:hypothetical protein